MRIPSALASWTTEDTKLDLRLGAAPLFANGDHQSVGVCVLGNPGPKDRLGLLNAGHVPLDHALVEFIKIRNL